MRIRVGVLTAAILLAGAATLWTQETSQQQQQEPARPAGPIRPAHIVLRNGKVWTLEESMPKAEAVAIRGQSIMAVGTNEEIKQYIGEGFTRVINLRGRLVLPGFIDNHTHFAQAGRLLLGLNLLDVHEPNEFRKRVREASERLPPGAWLVGGDWGAYEKWSEGSVSRTPEPPAAAEPPKPPETAETEPKEEPPATPQPQELPDAPAPETKPEESPEEEPEQPPPSPAGEPGEQQEAPQPAGEQEPSLPTEEGKEQEPEKEEPPPVDPWPPLQGFLPTKELIDPVTPTRPALISRFDGEVYLANSAALRAAGIDASTPDPSGGRIERDAIGQPTGLLRGKAVRLVEKVIPPKSFEQRKAEALRALDEARQYGVTSIHDNIGDIETLELFQDLQKTEELTLRVWGRVRLDAWDAFLAEYIRLYRLPFSYGGWGDQYIRLGGLKGWVDGIMGNSTALFFEPYDHQPESRGRLRDIMFPEGNLYRLVKGADAAGFTVTVHAIGDRANRILLDTYERVIKENPPRVRRFRVVHAQVVHPADFKRFGEMNLIAEVQPYHCIDDMRWMEERIGDRAKTAYAFKSLQDAGATLSFGSDWPGTNASYYPINPLLGMYAAVTRKTLDGQPFGGWFPAERISIEDAIRFYTINNAYAAFEETLKGSIKENKLADLVVLDRDILLRPPEELPLTRVDYTIFGGKIIYDRAAKAQKPN